MDAHYLGLLGFSTLYAVLLSTKAGQAWADDQTWTTVVFGVGMVIGWIWMADPGIAETVFGYFAVAGVPIIVRSLVLQFLRNRRWLNSKDIDQ
jgi:hypothetical protein